MAGDAARPAAVIFSKDRPLQLDAAIRSLRLFGRDPGRLVTRVLWTSSTADFTRGYRALAGEHPSTRFHRERNFKADLGRLTGDASHIVFVVDDSLFVASFSIGEAIAVLDSDPSSLGFSFRLGRNTSYCYPMDRPQALPVFESVGPGILTYDWTHAELDFGYPLEVSSSMYRASDLRPLLESLSYRNPNSLESALARAAGMFADSRPRLACLERSVAVSIPANVVQTAAANRVAADVDGSPAALLRHFRNGDRLDLRQYVDLIPNACHQEVALIYERSSRLQWERRVRWELARPRMWAGRIRRRLRALGGTFRDRNLT